VRHASTTGQVAQVKSQPQVQSFYARFLTRRAIKSAEDLAAVPFADRGQQLDNIILALGMDLCFMLANDDLEEATATRIFDSVRKFYVAVVNKTIKIFPFHDDVLRDLAALSASGVLEFIFCS